MLTQKTIADYKKLKQQMSEMTRKERELKKEIMAAFGRKKTVQLGKFVLIKKEVQSMIVDTQAVKELLGDETPMKESVRVSLNIEKM